mmetsp:Transcript_35864/g.114867  ORF Transcript_35864/g.114867 Transcript_35864/m.114867 type:complete len:671 (+) Transcript_35864:52-2064(+)
MAAAAGEAAEDEELPLPSCGTFDYGGGLREVAIVSAIEEYFSYHHLQRPLEAFRRDVDRTGLRQTPSRASSALLLGVEDVLAHFDAGLRVEFAAAWARSLPEDFRSGRAGRALELRLQAHFATLRARQTLQEGGEPDPTQLQVDLEPFRAFLGSQGLDEVCGDEALMPLFALPFVQRPHAQPLVAVVFKAKWLQDLRRDVDAALRAQHPQIPLLYDLIEPQPGGQTGQADGTAWRRVWSELLRVADFGLDAATMLAHGIPISGELLQKARRQLQMLREQVPGGLELRLLSELPIGGPGVMSPARSVRSRAATAPPQMPRDLDFGRLAHFLRARADERERLFAGAGPPPTLAAVLRALLQRLASAEAPLAQRRGFLVAVACFDVLGVRARPGALPELLADPSLAELTLGMLAVLACEAVGRTYIVANLSCVESVVEILKAQQLDSSLHIQALAAMQRLSLRRAPQDRMIELGLVEWVIGVLGWQEEAIQGMPSEFSLEFGSAMLMNLALRTSGKRKCAELDALTVHPLLAAHGAELPRAGPARGPGADLEVDPRAGREPRRRDLAQADRVPLGAALAARGGGNRRRSRRRRERRGRRGRRRELLRGGGARRPPARRPWRPLRRGSTPRLRARLCGTGDCRGAVARIPGLPRPGGPFARRCPHGGVAAIRTN